MKKKKKIKVYKPDEQDMKDAWHVWLAVKSLRKDNLEDFDLMEIMKDLEVGLRLVLSRPEAKGSAMDIMMKRLYASWIQKSPWGINANKDLEKGKIDVYGAYAQAVFQTMLVTGPYDESKKDEFYDQRIKEMDEINKIAKEWNDRERKEMEAEGVDPEDDKRTQMAKYNAALIENFFNSKKIRVKVMEINFLEKFHQYCFESELDLTVDDILGFKKELAKELNSPTGKIEIKGPLPENSYIAINLPKEVIN